MIGSPNFPLGHTKIDKNAANFHQYQKNKYGWLNQSFGLCQFQLRKTSTTIGNFPKCHGSRFEFIYFEMSSHVKYLEAAHT